MKTRQLLEDNLLSKFLLEVNISKPSEVLLELRPKRVPTVIVVNKNKEIIFIKEDQMHPKDVQKLSEIITQINE